MSSVIVRLQTMQNAQARTKEQSPGFGWASVLVSVRLGMVWHAVRFGLVKFGLVPFRQRAKTERCSSTP